MIKLVVAALCAAMLMSGCNGLGKRLIGNSYNGYGAYDYNRPDFA